MARAKKARNSRGRVWRSVFASLYALVAQRRAETINKLDDRETARAADVVPGSNGSAPGEAASGDAASASPAPTAVNACADPGAIFREVYAVNGGFEEPWCAAFNAEVWHNTDVEKPNPPHR